jgi:hypothetical protein
LYCAPRLWPHLSIRAPRPSYPVLRCCPGSGRTVDSIREPAHRRERIPEAMSIAAILFSYIEGIPLSPAELAVRRQKPLPDFPSLAPGSRFAFSAGACARIFTLNSGARSL